MSLSCSLRLARLVPPLFIAGATLFAFGSASPAHAATAVIDSFDALKQIANGSWVGDDVTWTIHTNWDPVQTPGAAWDLNVYEMTSLGELSNKIDYSASTSPTGDTGPGASGYKPDSPHPDGYKANLRVYGYMVTYASASTTAYPHTP